MIIDFHTHIFPDKIAKNAIELLSEKVSVKPNTDGTVDGLIENMQNAKCDLAITLPVVTSPKQFDGINRFAVEINKKYNGKTIISFGGIHPHNDNIPEKMRFLKDCGLKGVKIHPDYQQTFIDDAGYIEILQCAKELDMIVVTHAGLDEGYIGQPIRCPVDRVKKVIEHVNHSKFVLAHFGGHSMWDEVYNELCGMDVYFDTANTFGYIDETLFKKIIEKHGADRVLFATDCPWQDIKKDVEIFKAIGLSKEAEQKILYKNALKLLELQ